MESPIIKRGYNPSTWIKKLSDDYVEYIYEDEDGKLYWENKLQWFTCTNQSGPYSEYSYLPRNYQYYGMKKVKAGKGYRDGRPIGVLGGKCPECEGQVINTQMNTSARGFETSNEKVCSECGLVMPLGFQILNIPHKDYRCKPYDTHEAWLEDMKKSAMDNRETAVAWDAELFEHKFGVRLDDDTEGDGAFSVFMNSDNADFNRITQLISKYIDTDMEDWRRQQYIRYIGVCKTLLGMNMYQVEDVVYILDKHPNILNISSYSHEDILLCLSIYVMSRCVNNARLSVIKRQIPAWKDKYSRLYNVVCDKLNNNQ